MRPTARCGCGPGRASTPTCAAPCGRASSGSTGAPGGWPTGRWCAWRSAASPAGGARPDVVWLWWQPAPAPGNEPRPPSPEDLDVLWRGYCRRADLEQTFRFMKQVLGWVTPRVRLPEQADRWTWLVLAAYTQLRLARGAVADHRLPWERPLPPAPAHARAGAPEFCNAGVGAAPRRRDAKTLRPLARAGPKGAARRRRRATRPSRRPPDPRGPRLPRLAAAFATTCTVAARASVVKRPGPLSLHSRVAVGAAWSDRSRGGASPLSPRTPPPGGAGSGLTVEQHLGQGAHGGRRTSTPATSCSCVRCHTVNASWPVAMASKAFSTLPSNHTSRTAPAGGRCSVKVSRVSSARRCSTANSSRRGPATAAGQARAAASLSGSRGNRPLNTPLPALLSSRRGSAPGAGPDAPRPPRHCRRRRRAPTGAWRGGRGGGAAAPAAARARRPGRGGPAPWGAPRRGDPAGSGAPRGQRSAIACGPR